MAEKLITPAPVKPATTKLEKKEKPPAVAGKKTKEELRGLPKLPPKVAQQQPATPAPATAAPAPAPEANKT